jgi:N-acetylmuramoyl-L-alanine amidase
MSSRSFMTGLLALALAWPAGAVSVTTGTGNVVVFSRADLVDVVGLLRLTGAEVNFSPAAGSYVAANGKHDVQFTPGGSLAVVDGNLVPLPGPVRLLEGHVVANLTVATALLAPFGWAVRGGPEALQLVAVQGSVPIELSVVQSASGTLLVVRGVSTTPRLSRSYEQIDLTFPVRVTLTQPVAPSGGLLGAEIEDSTLHLRLAPGLDVVTTYPLEDPPRFVLRLGPAENAAAPVQTPSGPIVVLDPGHGGEDRGAQGPGGELEKDITLAVARLTAAQLQAAGITTRLTRDGDEAISLNDRTALANRLHAVAFLSIHVNASPAKGARGAETYFMNADPSDVQAAQAAARENAGSPPNAVQLILWDLAYVANLNASARLAGLVQTQMNALHGIPDRGVKQAPFVVLVGATMPAALVEIGFLSNPDEAAKLVSPDTQSAIAAALASAVTTFVRTPATTPPPEATPTPRP